MHHIQYQEYKTFWHYMYIFVWTLYTLGCRMCIICTFCIPVLVLFPLFFLYIKVSCIQKKWMSLLSLLKITFTILDIIFSAAVAILEMLILFTIMKIKNFNYVLPDSRRHFTQNEFSYYELITHIVKKKERKKEFFLLQILIIDTTLFIRWMVQHEHYW